jgi:hypothetical protein
VAAPALRDNRARREAIDAAHSAPACDWIRERNAYIDELRRRIDDGELLRTWMEAKITECGALLRLPDRPEPACRLAERPDPAKAGGLT